MKFPTTLSAAIALTAVLASSPAAFAGGVSATLRGSAAITEGIAAPPLASQATSDTRIPRTFADQPPLIPHDIEALDIDAADNACLQCHDRAVAADAGAPAAAASHYRDRDGKALGQISRGRWFCSQCHVPQTDTRPLVRNEFEAGN